MIKEIKEIKLKEIKNELQVYEEKKQDYESTEKSLAEIRKMNIFQRILKHFEYKRKSKDARNYEFSENEENLKTLRNEFEKIKRTENLKDLGMDFQEAIKLLNQNDIPAVLEEEDKKITPVYRDFEGLEDFILVHKTNYIPINNEIYTSKNAGAYYKGMIEFNGKEYEYTYRSERDTVHFAVNGEVLEHAYGSNWNNSKYAILIPFQDIPKENIANAVPSDTYTVGNVKLSENTWILCPKGQKEEIQNKNPNLKVIEYDGECVMEYAETFLSTLGYKRECVSNHGWVDRYDSRKFSEIVEQNGFTEQEHYYSKERMNELTGASRNHFISLINLIKFKKEILNDMDTNQILECLTDDNPKKIKIDKLFEDAIVTENCNEKNKVDNLKGIFEGLRQNGMRVPDDIQDILVKLCTMSRYASISEEIKDIDFTTEIIDFLQKEMPKYDQDGPGYLNNSIKLGGKLLAYTIISDLKREQEKQVDLSNEQEQNIQ